MSLRLPSFLLAVGAAAAAGMAVLTHGCASFPDYDLDRDAAPSDGSSGSLDRDAAAASDGSTPPPPSTPQCVPPIAPVDTSGTRTLVGTGTAASCTESALRETLPQVPAGGVLAFDCGTQPVTISLTETLVLDATRSLVIDGGNIVTLDGGDAVRILSWQRGGFRANNQSLVLQGLRFAHGRARGSDGDEAGSGEEGSGGALFFQDGLLRIHQCSFQDNAAENGTGGGAVYASGALSVQISSSTFTNNRAASGGAVLSNHADLSVFDSSFLQNQALGTGGIGGMGGAIYAQGGTEGAHRYCGLLATENQAEAGGALMRTHSGAPRVDTTIEYSTIASNRTQAGGGSGVKLQRVDATISAVSLVDNETTGAGAFNMFDGALVLVNTTVARNTGAFAGLALGTVSGTLRNCTIAENHALAFNAAVSGASSSLTLVNSIVSDNVSDNAQPTNPQSCGGGFDDAPSSPSSMGGGAGSIQFPGTGFDGPCAPSVQVVPPALGTLDSSGARPVYVPAASSPARRANTEFCPETDALGVARPASGCTAGAVQ